MKDPCTLPRHWAVGQPAVPPAALVAPTAAPAAPATHAAAETAPLGPRAAVHTRAAPPRAAPLQIYDKAATNGFMVIVFDR